MATRSRRSRVVDQACRQLTQQMAYKGKPGVSISYIARASGVSTTTLYNMRNRKSGSYSPHLKTIEFALRPLGYELVLREKDD